MAKRRKAGNDLDSSAEKPVTNPSALLSDLRYLIRQTREGVAQAVNSALVLLYWEVGQRIRTEILKQVRATYGDEILSTLSNKLAAAKTSVGDDALCEQQWWLNGRIAFGSKARFFGKWRFSAAFVFHLGLPRR